jgi:hypothetical protein
MMIVYTSMMHCRLGWCSGGRHSAHAAPLLQRSPNILLIPGTSSVEHLRENGADGMSDPAAGRTAMSGGERAFFPRLTAPATTLKRDLAVPREVNLV